MTQTVFGKHWSNVSHKPTWRREGFIACTAADHQMKMSWPQFWECGSSSIHLSVALPIHLLSSTYLASGHVEAAYARNSGDPSPQTPFSALPGGYKDIPRPDGICDPSITAFCLKGSDSSLSCPRCITGPNRRPEGSHFIGLHLRPHPFSHYLKLMATGEGWDINFATQLSSFFTTLVWDITCSTADAPSNLTIFTWGSDSPKPRWSNLQSGPWPQIWRRWLLHMQLGGSSCTIVQTYNSRY